MMEQGAAVDAVCRAPNRTTTNDLEFVARQPNERICVCISVRDAAVVASVCH